MRKLINKLALALLPALTVTAAAHAQGLETDATVVTGVNIAGTVRVCNQAILEAFLNIFVNCSEIAGILIGSVLLFQAGLQENSRKRVIHAIVGVSTICAGLMVPGATLGTIGSQFGDATVVAGVNTAGTVRINCLANLDALLIICANGLEIAGVLTGSVMLIRAATRGPVGNKRWLALGVATLPILVGLAAPGVINWLVFSAREFYLFS